MSIVRESCARQACGSRSSQPGDEIAFPASGDGTVLGLGRTLADQNLIGHEALPTQRPGSRDAQRPTCAQAGGQLAPERATALMSARSSRPLSGSSSCPPGDRRDDQGPRLGAVRSRSRSETTGRAVSKGGRCGLRLARDARRTPSRPRCLKTSIARQLACPWQRCTVHSTRDQRLVDRPHARHAATHHPGTRAVEICSWLADFAQRRSWRRP
jgi:hypothetical protein